MIISHTGNWKQRHSRAIDVIFLAVGTKKNPNLKQKPAVSVDTFINTKSLCTRFLMLVFCLDLCLGWLVMNNVW